MKKYSIEILFIWSIKGRAVRNARRKLPPNFEHEEVKRAPHVLVFKRGISGKNK